MVDKIVTGKYFAAIFSVLSQKLTIRRQQAAVSGCRGFTLVELIVVCAILGVLAAMAIPSMQGYIKITKLNACASDLRIIDKAVTAYYIDRNVLPPNPVLGDPTTGLSAVGLGAQLDPWKRPYVYRVNSGANPDPLALKETPGGDPLNYDYDLYSVGEDGVSSVDPDATTDDDVARTLDGVFVGPRP